MAGFCGRRSRLPTWRGYCVSQDVTAVDAVGTDDLWVVITDVPGLVTPNGGSSRGEGIESRRTVGSRGPSWPCLDA